MQENHLEVAGRFSFPDRRDLTPSQRAMVEPRAREMYDEAAKERRLRKDERLARVTNREEIRLARLLSVGRFSPGVRFADRAYRRERVHAVGTGPVSRAG